MSEHRHRTARRTVVMVQPVRRERLGAGSEDYPPFNRVVVSPPSIIIPADPTHAHYQSAYVDAEIARLTLELEDSKKQNRALRDQLLDVERQA